jgi:hypothetical protein
MPSSEEYIKNAEDCVAMAKYASHTKYTPQAEMMLTLADPVDALGSPHGI